MSLEIHHQNHALGDEIHIFTLIWYLQKNYDVINLHCNYKLMNRSRGSNYSNYIKPFIESLYKCIPNVKLHHDSRKGISKERLGRLVKPKTAIKLPDLFDLNAISDLPSSHIVLQYAHYIQ